MWQFERCVLTIQNYAPFAASENMFHGKKELDGGRGTGGKAVYDASLGAEKVIVKQNISVPRPSPDLRR